MSRSASLNPFLARQSGMALIFGLILLLIVTVLAVSQMRVQTVEQRMAVNMLDHQNAFQAAEASLRYVEDQIRSTAYPDLSGNAAGLYTFNPASTPLAITDPHFWQSSSAVLTYNGPVLSGLTLASQPVFIVESMPEVAVSGQSIAQTQYGAGVPPIQIYRVTTYAQGGNANTAAILQSIFY